MGLVCPSCSKKMNFTKQIIDGLDCSYASCEACGEFHDCTIEEWGDVSCNEQ